ncbi:MAG: hypothetical protein P8L49_07800 [Opitutaceae bacterium]|nr:hypothetical protein [Opitutaceae bacterium]
MNINERNPLIDELLDGSISEADFLRLEAELRVNPEARQAYYRRLKLNHALATEAEALVETVETPPMPFWVEHARALVGIAAIALFVMMGIMGWQLNNSNSSSEIAIAEPSATGYAILTEHSDAVWKNRPYLNRGDLMPQGNIQMSSGIAQLELFSGVTVIIEGEAEFEIHSPMEMTVANGKIRALVPTAAQGFKISTASGDVIDLGTEFALDVTSEHADMHVLQGEIEWHPTSKAKRLLTDGESLRWTGTGIPSSIGFETDTYPVMEDFARRFSAQRQERRNSWNEHSTLLRTDRRVLAYFPMNQNGVSGRQLIDVSGSNLHGTIVSARNAADRWDQSSSALNFSPTGSRVRVAIPGEHSSLTLHCWARIDSLDRMYNSLFLTDGHELNEPHWQIMNDGRLFFSVKKQDGAPGKGNDKHIAYSPSFWNPSLSGKWFQIATAYNVDEKTTTHYVNGKVVSKDRIPDQYVVETVKIGNASIGNWNEPTRADPKFALRNLNGAIDEFAIFNQALSSSEIADLYQKGRP